MLGAMESPDRLGFYETPNHFQPKYLTAAFHHDPGDRQGFALDLQSLPSRLDAVGAGGDLPLVGRCK